MRERLRYQFCSLSPEREYVYRMHWFAHFSGLHREERALSGIARTWPISLLLAERGSGGTLSSGRHLSTSSRYSR